MYYVCDTLMTEMRIEGGLNNIRDRNSPNHISTVMMWKRDFSIYSDSNLVSLKILPPRLSYLIMWATVCSSRELFFFHTDLLVSKENSSNSFKVDIVFFFFIAEVSDAMVNCIRILKITNEKINAILHLTNTDINFIKIVCVWHSKFRFFFFCYATSNDWTHIYARYGKT